MTEKFAKGMLGLWAATALWIELTKKERKRAASLSIDAPLPSVDDLWQPEDDDNPLVPPGYRPAMIETLTLTMRPADK